MINNSISHWSISPITITEEAIKLGLEVEILSKENNLYYIRSKDKEILFKSTDFGGNSALGFKLADNKELSYSILEKYNFPTVQTWYILADEIESVDTLNIKFPVIIKPLEDGHGNGVMMNIQSHEELKEKLSESFRVYTKMIIQKQVFGDEHRILVFKGEVIGAICRIPAHVIGNGISTIEELIEIENTNNPLRSEQYTTPLSFIEIDNELLSYIVKQDLTLNSIIEENQVAQLRGNSNIGTGGTIDDVKHKISKEVAQSAISVAQKFGLEFAGIDIITTDITKSLEETGGIILEVNANPGIGSFSQLEDYNVANIMLKELFFNK